MSLKFLKHYSSIENKNGQYIPSTSGNHIFSDLSIKGTQFQKEIYEKFKDISNEIELILTECPDQYLNDYKKNKNKILVLIEQEGRTWKKSINECVEEIEESFDFIIDLLDKLFGIEKNKSTILVPDTNAFLLNPDIEKWSFKNIDSFKIALTPIILEELDKHKINHNNQNVRNKSKKIINKIKEYRRRGKLTEGVNIVNNKIELFVVAKEPDIEKSLSWLDKNNNDDIFIASIIEIIREYLNSVVILVTKDINLQNKCELANIPFLEPPE